MFRIISLACTKWELHTVWWFWVQVTTVDVAAPCFNEIVVFDNGNVKKVLF